MLIDISLNNTYFFSIVKKKQRLKDPTYLIKNVLLEKKIFYEF